VPPSDLEPTQRWPTYADADDDDLAPEDLAPDAEPSRLGGLLGLLGKVLLVLFIVVGALVAASLFMTPPRESLLVLGSDARPDELRRGDVGRTDTLLLLVGDRAQPRFAMVSLPRDLWVPIPGYGEERINAAFELGGAQAAKQTVSNVLGQRVDRYAVIGLQGVRDIVDAVGGVEITVPQAIHDETYPTDDYGYQVVDIPAGRQRMDGDTALKYARTRHQDSDFGRIARQQQVLAAVRTALLNPTTWPRIPAVAAAVGASVKTDLSVLDAIALGAAALRDFGDPDRLVVDASLVTPVTGAGGAFLLEAKAELRPTVAKFLGSSTTAPATVAVLNGAGTAGLAGRTGERLTQSGLSVQTVGDAPQTQAQTTISVRPGARAAGEQVARALNLPTSRVSENSALGTVDVQVILGTDAR
jgi:LCP family protein required for cell wall assembly